MNPRSRNQQRPMIPDSRSKTVTIGTPVVDSHAVIARLLRRWLEIANNRPLRPGTGLRPAERWISLLVDEASKILGGCQVQLLTQAGSQWEVLAQQATVWTDSIDLKMETLIFSGLDSPQPVCKGNAIVVAIHRGGDAVDAEWSVALAGNASITREQSEIFAANQFVPTVLLIRLAEGNATIDSAFLEAVATIASTFNTLDRQQHLTGIMGACAVHLRRLLDLSIQWTQIEQTDQLLEAIATSSAELLAADRASIFLWDRKRGKLVGRPALGVEGGKLEVDDNAGIVSTVLSTGCSRIWNQREDSESEVNRAVDKKLKFKTKSLVAVPLKSPSGATIGVFEVINKKQGWFDANDAARLNDLARHAAAAIQGTETRQRLTSVRDRLLQDAASTYQVIGDSPAIRTLRDTVARVARTDLAVLALGENGTGKEVLARSIHFQSSRRDQPFIAVNCAALVESLLESELFGHERGAFTDAVQARPGKFELATGGTLFLDEIGDMSPGGQAKLLRVLEEKIVVRVGGSTPIPVDVRIIAATNQSLPELVAAKKFREDLFFRLNVVSFRLPPLRERGEDILTLATHFMKHFATQVGRSLPTFSAEAKQALLRHRWPGNVRELRNVMERACYLSLNDDLTEADLGLTSWDTSSLLTPNSTPATPSDAASSASTATAGSMPLSGVSLPSSSVSLNEATRIFQVSHIQQAIDHCRGNMTSAAELLGLHRSNLYRKMKQLEMKFEEDDAV